MEDGIKAKLDKLDKLDREPCKLTLTDYTKQTTRAGQT